VGAINYDGKWCLGGLKKQACPAEMWLPNHNNSAKGARRMGKNTPIECEKPGTIIVDGEIYSKKSGRY